MGDGGAAPPFGLGTLWESPAAVDAAVEAMSAVGAFVRKPPH